MAERSRRIIDFLEKRYGPINHRYREDPFKVLISCVISQRTREENTEVASRNLFAVAGTPDKIARLSMTRLQRLIRPSGPYRQKAKHIKTIAKIVLEKYHGRVPRTRPELLALPGIGPKCSAIVLSYGFGIPIIAVDVNVNRTVKRLGLANIKDSVEAVREKLQRFFPRAKWHVVNLGMVQFGRELCLPRNPRCTRCPFNSWCAAYRSGNFQVS